MRGRVVIRLTLEPRQASAASAGGTSCAGEDKIIKQILATRVRRVSHTPTTVARPNVGALAEEPRF
jgi:hypothetical protein